MIHPIGVHSRFLFRLTRLGDPAGNFEMPRLYEIRRL